MSYSFQYPPTDDEFAQVAKAQEAHARDIAEKLRRGEALAENEAAFAAIALCEWADAQRVARRRGRGRPVKVNKSTVALHFEGLVRRGLSGNAAKDRLAEIYEVDIDTISNALAVKGADAKALYDVSQRKKPAP